MIDTTSARSAGSRQLALLAMVFESWFVIALIALHILRPDLKFTRSMISQYALGPHGGLMTSAFVAAAMGYLMLLLALIRTGPAVPSARLGELLLAVSVLGLLTSAVFPMDASASVRTQAGRLHEASFMVNVSCSLISALLLSVSFGSDARWRPFVRTAWVLSLAQVVALVLQVVTIVARNNWGVANRLFVVTVVIWVFAVASQSRVAASSATLITTADLA